MKNINKSLLLVAVLSFLSACGFVDQVAERARELNSYDNAALNLAKENRSLMTRISKLEFEIQTLKAKNEFMALQIEQSKGTPTRSIASIPQIDPKDDYVKFDVYKWDPSQILAMAESEFEKKNYDQSAQYYHALISQYSGFRKIDDQLLFQAGIAAFESGKYFDWSISTMDKIINEYPASPFFRGAKIWKAISNLKKGNKDEFFNTVEEFRKKYRNTNEWTILSAHYEDILQKYKR